MPIYGHFFHHREYRYAQIELSHPLGGQGGAAFFVHDLFKNPTFTHEYAPMDELDLLPPSLPRKVFAIGLNYADHAAEHGNEIPDWPLMWFKAPSSLLPHNGVIEIAYPDHRTDYEAELALVIGKTGKRIREEDALDYIVGVTCAQDISDRVIQRSESQWARGKSLDTYTPLGPYLYTGLDLSNLSIQCIVNGEIKQNGNTRDMIFSPAKIVSFLSQAITLEPGDVILTGTPAGVGPLKAGDVVETRIGDMMPLINTVVDAALQR